MSSATIPSMHRSRLPWAGRLKRIRMGALGAVVLLAIGTVFASGVAFLTSDSTTTVTAGGTITGRFADVYTSSLSTLTNVSWAESGGATKRSATWNAAIGQASEITTSGDLAIIDARGTDRNLLITIALVNPVQLAGNYAYMMLPIEIYQRQDTSLGSWAAAVDSAGDDIQTQYLTIGSGPISFVVNGGQGSVAITDYYQLSLGTGGSMYTVSVASNGTHSLSPEFLVTVAAIG